MVNLACQKPKELGYAQELWTTRLLAKHIRNHSRAAGHEHLAKPGRGTVSKILAAHPVRPHKLEYYLERRDPDGLAGVKNGIVRVAPRTFPPRTRRTS